MRRFASWARDELLSSVEKRFSRIEALTLSADDAVVDESDGSLSQIAALRDEVRHKGKTETLRRAAYLWFLRLAAIRYMEVNGLLPLHVRMLSAPDGSFNPECLTRALDIPLDASKTLLVSRYVQAGDDCAIMRLLLLSQCNALSGYLPFLFDRNAGPYDLLLPDDLLRQDGILCRFVVDLPDRYWQSGIDVFGYLFEGYIESRKRRVREKVKRDYRLKGEDYAVMAQTCTASWPGRYLVDNSLGRLLSEDEEMSSRFTSCEYLLENGRGRKRSIEIEDLAVADFACGSGMLLAYSLELLVGAYAAMGYSAREATRLSIEHNLIGFDVDERAVLHSELALAFKACEYDKRFLRRGITPRIVLLESVGFSHEERAACPHTAKCADLLSSVAHLSECGSLLFPREGDLDALRSDAEGLMVSNPDAAWKRALADKLTRLLRMLEPLSVQYDVVLCDAPRADAKRISRWFAKWISRHYPNDRLFLPAAFIDRSLLALREGGYAAAFSSSALLFSNFASAFRGRLLELADIICIIETTDGQGLRWCSDAGWILSPACGEQNGMYVRLNQFGEGKEAALQEVARGARHDLVYRKDKSFFEAIPGIPIAYWAPESVARQFGKGISVSRFAMIYGGMSSGNANRFVREWYELSLSDRGWDYHPYVRGGAWRKWYGNLDQVIRWGNDGEEIKRSYAASSLRLESHFKPGIVWGNGLAFRLLDSDEFMIGGQGILLPDPGAKSYFLGLLNSSAFEVLYKAVNSEFNSNGGEIGNTPAVVDADKREAVDELVRSCLGSAKADYESREIAWGFLRNPLC